MSIDVVTFGCRLNIYESEVIRRAPHSRPRRYGRNEYLRGDRGSGAAGEPGDPPHRRERPDARIVVTGCAAQTEAKTFAAMPEVDRVIGNEEKFDASVWADGRQACRVRHHGGETMRPHAVDHIEGHTRAFVQVQNGCDHRCTFCIIPFGRGNSRSLPLDDVMAQAQRLVANGYREIVLTGVDITSYGSDLPARRAWAPWSSTSSRTFPNWRACGCPRSIRWRRMPIYWTRWPTSRGSCRICICHCRRATISSSSA